MGFARRFPPELGGGHTPKVIDCVNKEEFARQRSIRAKLQDERNITENVMMGKGYEGVVESWCVAMRGRNPERPTDRTAGLPTEQRLEPVK